MATRTCKYCKEKFDQQRPNQIVCSPGCAYEYTKAQNKKKRERESKAKTKEMKAALKTKQDYEKELETIFNKFIRLRDQTKPCISCCAAPGQYRLTAGHFYPAGSYKNIRFDEDNVHGQCWFNCNKNKHGNLHEYRIHLNERIGIEKVKALDARSLSPRHYSIPELVELKVIYRDKIKALKK